MVCKNADTCINTKVTAVKIKTAPQAAIFWTSMAQKNRKTKSQTRKYKRETEILLKPWCLFWKAKAEVQLFLIQFWLIFAEICLNFRSKISSFLNH